jgi:N-acetylmuramoyl-L-alanine amidase
LRETDCPAVLLELGFMDSTTDVPIILTDKYAQQCAKAIVEILVKKGNLTKKKKANNTLYRVQVGAFSNKENADKLVKQLKAKGYQAYVV